MNAFCKHATFIPHQHKMTSLNSVLGSIVEAEPFRWICCRGLQLKIGHHSSVFEGTEITMRGGDAVGLRAWQARLGQMFFSLNSSDVGTDAAWAPAWFVCCKQQFLTRKQLQMRVQPQSRNPSKTKFPASKFCLRNKCDFHKWQTYEQLLWSTFWSTLVNLFDKIVDLVSEIDCTMHMFRSSLTPLLPHVCKAMQRQDKTCCGSSMHVSPFKCFALIFVLSSGMHTDSRPWALCHWRGMGRITGKIVSLSEASKHGLIVLSLCISHFGPWTVAFWQWLCLAEHSFSWCCHDVTVIGQLANDSVAELSAREDWSKPKALG